MNDEINNLYVMIVTIQCYTYSSSFIHYNTTSVSGVITDLDHVGYRQCVSKNRSGRRSVLHCGTEKKIIKLKKYIYSVLRIIQIIGYIDMLHFKNNLSFALIILCWS